MTKQIELSYLSQRSQIKAIKKASLLEFPRRKDKLENTVYKLLRSQLDEIYSTFKDARIDEPEKYNKEYIEKQIVEKTDFCKKGKNIARKISTDDEFWDPETHENATSMISGAIRTYAEEECEQSCVFM